MRRLAPLFAALLCACGAPPETPAGSPIEGPGTVPESASQLTLPADMFPASDQAEQARLLNLIADGKPAFDGLPNPELASCGLVAGDETTCRYEQLKFLRDWAKAYRGDYQAQRNVAYCLSRSCTGVQRNIVQGCAWRAVILNAAHAKAVDGDVSNLEVECGALSQPARVAADAQAARIASVIAS